jgi:hypothetical protein
MKQPFNPYAEEWGLEEDKIYEAAAPFSKDWNSPFGKHKKLRLFLYAKGIWADEPSVFRKSKFDQLLNGPEDEPALQRLKAIVEIGEKARPRSEDDEYSTMFDLFVSKHEEWSKGKAHVVFRDRDDLKHKPQAHVERIQDSGLCYMHAGVVLQHYLVAMNREESVPMLNVAKYLKKYTSGDPLYRHIWRNEGGDSLDFFETIWKKKLGPLDSESYINLEELNNLREQIDKYGPGLVSGFSVTKDFTGEQWQHTGFFRRSEFLGYHAMVLIGYRMVGEGQYRYLLQNWWRNKPYVEVDGEYLRSSWAKVHFMTKPILEMGEYPKNNEALVECPNGLDAPENFIPECL